MEGLKKIRFWRIRRGCRVSLSNPVLRQAANEPASAHSPQGFDFASSGRIGPNPTSTTFSSFPPSSTRLPPTE